MEALEKGMDVPSWKYTRALDLHFPPWVGSI